MSPEVNAIAAMTLDGKIARHAHHMSDWTSVEAKAFLHEELDASDVVIVGKTTYDIAFEPLSKRNCIVLTRGVSIREQRSDSLVYFNATAADVREELSRYRRAALLGGTQVYTYFLEQNLIDRLYLTIEPLVFGSGLPLFNSTELLETRFVLASHRVLNDSGTVLLTYEKGHVQRDI